MPLPKIIFIKNCYYIRLSQFTYVGSAFGNIQGSLFKFQLLYKIDECKNLSLRVLGAGAGAGSYEN